MTTAMKEKKSSVRSVSGNGGMPSILFIINEAAGTGRTPDDIACLVSFAVSQCGSASTIRVEETDNHETVTKITEAFLQRKGGRKIIIAGGGGGTLRAVITGIYNTREKRGDTQDPPVVAALRMGSGNVLAKTLGIEKDPYKGLQQIFEGIRYNQIRKVCVGRFDFTDRDFLRRTIFGVTLMGFGAFGGIPGAIGRFHKRHPFIHRLLAGIVGIESLTPVEYGVLLGVRSAAGLFFPDRPAKIGIGYNGKTVIKRIIAGLIMNFPVSSIPLDPGIVISDEALYFHAVPYHYRLDLLELVGKPQHLPSISFSVTRECGVDINFHPEMKNKRCMKKRSVKPAEIFIDEDPYFVRGALHVSVAGMIEFINASPLRTRSDKEVMR
ncbi:MAG: hypothetical protein JW881_16535 [Spirochaetales bacterium]|nr:hypothetical protein [Spirochaetales bacterium]